MNTTLPRPESTRLSQQCSAQRQCKHLAGCYITIRAHRGPNERKQNRSQLVSRVTEDPSQMSFSEVRLNIK